MLLSRCDLLDACETGYLHRGVAAGAGLAIMVHTSALHYARVQRCTRVIVSRRDKFVFDACEASYIHWTFDTVAVDSELS